MNEAQPTEQSAQRRCAERTARTAQSCTEPHSAEPRKAKPRSRSRAQSSPFQREDWRDFGEAAPGSLTAAPLPYTNCPEWLWPLAISRSGVM